MTKSLPACPRPCAGETFRLGAPVVDWFRKGASDGWAWAAGKKPKRQMKTKNSPAPAKAARSGGAGDDRQYRLTPGGSVSIGAVVLTPGSLVTEATLAGLPVFIRKRFKPCSI